MKTLALQIPDDKPIAMLTVGELKAVLASVGHEPAAAKYITTAEALGTYGMAKDALDSRGISRVKRGRAWVWSVAEIEAYLATNAAPGRPRLRKATSVNEDPLDQMIAHGELRRTR